MRSFEEIKADIEKVRPCDEDWRTKCGEKFCEEHKHKCRQRYSEYQKALDAEFLQAITVDIPLDRLEEICQAERDNRLEIVPAWAQSIVFQVGEVKFNLIVGLERDIKIETAEAAREGKE